MNVYTPISSNIPHSNGFRIFLAGPTLRDNTEFFTPWRYYALGIFAQKQFEGDLFIPEPFTGNYTSQINWEQEYLSSSTCILFWIPRDRTTLPGFTTNVEFGEWMKSNLRKETPQVVLGYPKEALHMGYLEFKAKKYNVPIAHTLEETIQLALNKCEEFKWKM